MRQPLDRSDRNVPHLREHVNFCDCTKRNSDLRPVTFLTEIPEKLVILRNIEARCLQISNSAQRTRTTVLQTAPAKASSADKLYTIIDCLREIVAMLAMVLQKPYCQNIAIF